MGFGKELGGAEIKSTSMTVTPGPGKGRRIQMNCEGASTGDVPYPGTILGTLTIEGELNATSGTWSWCGSTFTAEGEILNHDGGGTWERLAPGKLRFHGTEVLSDGGTVGIEMVGELATRTLTAKIYELN